MEPNWKVVPCKSCARPMIWARSAAGHNFPLDAEPTKDGDFALIEVLDVNDPNHPPLAMYARKKPEAKTLLLRRSHFSTCPDAESWRKARKEKSDETPERPVGGGGPGG